jgi:integrase
MPNGSKLWRYRFRFEGRETMRGLGAYDPGSEEHMSIADAREKRNDQSKLVRKGSKPDLKRKPKPAVPVDAGEVTFERAAREWLAAYKPRLTPKYGAVIERRVEKWLIPALASRDSRTITGQELLHVIKQIESTGSIDLSRRMKILAGQILRFAVAHGWADRDISTDIRDGLSPRPAVKHRAKLKARDLPEFYRRLEDCDSYPITKAALRFIAVTAVRTDELREAAWSEIGDLNGKAPLWRIPPERMKPHGFKLPPEHLVPLPPQAVAILKEARALYPQSRLLFPSEESRNGTMSENCLLYLMYRLGYKGRATVHGFRGTFSTILHESGKFKTEWIERQLAHVDKDEVRGSYNSAEYLPLRRKMLKWWADYLDKCQDKGSAKAEKSAEFGAEALDRPLCGL